MASSTPVIRPAAVLRIKPQLFSRLTMMVILAGGIGVVVGLGLYVAKVTYVALLPIGIAVFLPTFFLKNFRIYWLVIFLLSLQIPITKNLNDGLAVVDALNIDYTIWNFTFDITLSDLPLAVLLVIWANDHIFQRKRLRFPPYAWLAVGYLAFCLISTIGSSSPYLGYVEISRQIKFFLIYLLTINWIDSKKILRVLAIVGVIILTTQASVTTLRFFTGWMTPLTLGDQGKDQSQIDEYLSIDRSDENSWVRSFGTESSPGSTVRLCMMVIPFVLFLCVPNPMFKTRWLFTALTVFGIGGLILTFTRVFYVTTAVQLLLAFFIMIRDRLLKRQEVILLITVALVSLAAASPKIYKQFTVRADSVTVRFLQYETAFKMIIAHPLFGVGINNGTAEKRNYTNITYNAYDPDTQFYLEPTHNMYLSLISEIGVIGALLFFTFFGCVTINAWRLSRSSGDAEIRMVANVFFVVFCSVASNSLMDPLFEYPVLALLWMYAGLIYNMPVMASDETARSGLISPKYVPLQRRFATRGRVRGRLTTNQ